MNTAQALVNSLEKEGIEYIFGVPGEENLDVLDAIKDSEHIKFILTRHEQSAGFMAATIGRLTGRPGVALSTLGPGAANLVTAAAYAQLGAMPMVMITGQKPIRHSKQGAFQIIDVVGMMQPIAKYATQLVEGNLISATVREAVRTSMEERPGAVHIEIPEDIAAEKVDTAPLEVSSARRPIAEQKSIGQVVDLLKEAKRPLLVVGAAANRKRTSKSLTEFVKRFNVPFVPTQMGKGVIDESLDQYAGTAALSSSDFVHHAIGAADLILNVGHDIVEKPPFIMDGSQKVVHINFDSAQVNDIYNPHIEVIGDIANSVWQIHQLLEDHEHSCAWESGFHQQGRKMLDDSFERYLTESQAITPHVVVDAVRSQSGKEDIVTLDNGMYKIWFARHYRTFRENTLLLDNALATMGAGLPSAMAAKLVHPEKQVIAVVGDGGFMMNSQELETAVRLGLDLTLLILNDGSYQMIRWKQQAQGLEDWGLTYNNPNFVMYAQSYGAEAVRVDTPQELEDALRHAANAGGVQVIDVGFDYRKNAEALKI